MSRDRSKDPPKSAAELMRELQKDPEHVSRMQQRDRQQLENLESYRRAVEPIVTELSAIGLHVDSLSELRERGTHYESAVPAAIVVVRTFRSAWQS
jgi:hypothetical protein